MDLQFLDRKPQYKGLSENLKRLGLLTVSDFLLYPPFKYIDVSETVPIGNIQEETFVTVIGTPVSLSCSQTGKGKRYAIVWIINQGMTMQLVFFGYTPCFLKGKAYAFSGKIEMRQGIRRMQNPLYEEAQTRPLHTRRLLPVYPGTRQITSLFLRRTIALLLKTTDIPETLTPLVIAANNLLSRRDALYALHFPASEESIREAWKRLAFDELVMVQKQGQMIRNQWARQKNAFPMKRQQKKLASFIAKLPYALTSGQQKAVLSITGDIEKETPMNRLLTGDVGSGKTIVAAIAMYMCFLAGKQSLLLCPTEILAQQHYTTLTSVFTHLPLTIGLITGNITEKKRKQIAANTILVGTHALLSDKTYIRGETGMVVIDEQQRFGVVQRGILRTKAGFPHLLTMTATPIPRTLAITKYGFLSVSKIETMPKGRKAIKTHIITTQKQEEEVWARLEKEMKQGKQVYYVCPFIIPSSNLANVSAVLPQYIQMIKRFPDYKIAFIHGKMKPCTKRKIMEAFHKKEISLLVATPLIEVGIDAPNATSIVIRSSQRFGSAGLHQLRGRVGRGKDESSCFLFTEGTNTKRLVPFTYPLSGLMLSEFDQKKRGSGNIYGKNQHGTVPLRFASLSDTSLIAKTKAVAALPSENRIPLLRFPVFPD